MYLKNKNFFLIYKRKKFWENCVLRKEKYLRKFWTWKPENVITILRKFCTWKKLSKSKVWQKILRKGSIKKKQFGTINICHFWNNAPDWESRFTLVLDAAKSFDNIEKYFKQKFSKIKFPTKNSATHISISPWSGARGVKHLPFLKYNALEWEWPIFWDPSSTIGGDKHMRPLRFL